ncbi:MAG: hypothetical protein ACRDKT_09950 [Actinomycetota bacterium]
MKVQAKPKTRLVDIEEAPKPRQEEEDHPRIGVWESNFSIRLTAFSLVKSHAGDQEFSVGDDSESIVSLGAERFDLGQLRETELVGSR